MPKISVYNSEKITVTYDPKRCTHVAECLRRLPKVFDLDVKPWVKPDNATPDEVAEAIHHCPTGALHYERKDGGEPETVPAVNKAKIARGGPIYLSGRLALLDSNGEKILEDTRMALCRCGKSSVKPLCDNSHVADFTFVDKGEIDPSSVNITANKESGDGALYIKTVKNGPVVISGPLTLTSADETVCLEMTRCSICRCGASKNKPFCDGTHEKKGFEAD